MPDLNAMGMGMGLSMGMGMGGSPTSIPPIPRDGVCFSNLGHRHGIPLKPEDDEHGLCICQLISCMKCFHQTSSTRKGPISLLPYELAGTETSIGWTGGIETSAQARVRNEGLRIPITPKAKLPVNGKGFVHNPKPIMVERPIPMFPHPQMTDVLAVEEHLRWRLKEMGAVDPAVESRYGPAVGSSLALEGIELPELDDDDEGSIKGKNGGGGKVKVTRGKGKVRRIVTGGIPPKKDGLEGNGNGKKGRVCYLPKEWVEEDPSKRNMAIILTFRHFVKVSDSELYHHTPHLAITVPIDLNLFHLIFYILLSSITSRRAHFITSLFSKYSLLHTSSRNSLHQICT